MNIMSFKPSYELADFVNDINIIKEAGIYRVIIKKAYLSHILAKDGGTNTYVFFEVIDQKSKGIIFFNLFVAKNEKTTYLDKNAKEADYIGFRMLNAMMYLTDTEDIFTKSIKGIEIIYNNNENVVYLNSIYDKELCLGFDSEEYEGKNGVGVKLNLARIFNAQGQSVKEAKENLPAESWKNFKPKHISLADKYSKQENKNIQKTNEEFQSAFNDSENTEMPF